MSNKTKILSPYYIICGAYIHSRLNDTLNKPSRHPSDTLQTSFWHPSDIFQTHRVRAPNLKHMGTFLLVEARWGLFLLPSFFFLPSFFRGKTKSTPTQTYWSWVGIASWSGVWQYTIFILPTEHRYTVNVTNVLGQHVLHLLQLYFLHTPGPAWN